MEMHAAHIIALLITGLGAIRMLTAKPPKITDEPSDSVTACIL